MRLGSGIEKEIYIYAAAGAEVWIGESKWWLGRKVGKIEVQIFLRKGELVREAEGKDLQTLRLWFFAHDGFTKEAEALMFEKGVLWSTRDALDDLLKLVGLRQLPDI